MNTDNVKPQSIDDFISVYPPAVQEKLKKLRNAIRKAAPKATEAIKYGMPTFVLNGNLVHFSAWKDHIGFYPRVKTFEKELAAYEGGKGTVKFPMDKPLPLGLIEKMVRSRVKANQEKVLERKRK